MNGAATLPSSVGQRRLTFAVPVSSGIYEFRFFNAGRTRGCDEHHDGGLGVGCGTEREWC